jgi:uncharacterized membrane protein YedE/YeeE
MTGVLGSATLIAFGAAEGYAFFRTGMASPSALHDQMQFKSMIVMKLFLSAVGTSMLAQALMSKVDPKAFAASRQMSATSVGYKRAIGGCLILGAGMAVSGCGPTILPAQVAAQSGGTLMTLAGAGVGAVIYGFFGPAMFGPEAPTAAPGEKTSLDHDMGVSYASIAIPAGMALLGATAGLEALWPHAADVARLGTNLTNAWAPMLAGAVIGVNQIPLRYIAGYGQGGSTCIMNVVSTASAGIFAKGYQMKNLASAAQFFYVWVGGALGATYAMHQQDGTYVTAAGLGVEKHFIGGLLMVFGARLAHGCTCGHGISGMSELSKQSIVGAMCMFAGGMATALFV